MPPTPCAGACAEQVRKPAFEWSGAGEGACTATGGPVAGKGGCWELGACSGSVLAPVLDPFPPRAPATRRIATGERLIGSAMRAEQRRRLKRSAESLYPLLPSEASRCSCDGPRLVTQPANVHVTSAKIVELRIGCNGCAQPKLKHEFSVWLKGRTWEVKQGELGAMLAGEKGSNICRALAFIRDGRNGSCIRVCGSANTKPAASCKWSPKKMLMTSMKIIAIVGHIIIIAAIRIV